MQYNLKFQRFNSVLLFFSPESWNYAGRSVHGTDPCCFLTCLVLWELCEILLGFPRSLASTEQRKESRTPKALMLRNKHVNTILFVFRGQLRTPYMRVFFFFWKSRPWFWSLNCSSSLLARAKHKCRLKDFSWLQIKDCKMYYCLCSMCFFCFFQKPAGNRLRLYCATLTLASMYVIHTVS